MGSSSSHTLWRTERRVRRQGAATYDAAMRLVWAGVLLLALVGCGDAAQSGDAAPPASPSSQDATTAACGQMFRAGDSPMQRVADFWTTHGATREEAADVQTAVDELQDLAATAVPEIAEPLQVVVDETQALLDSIGGKARDATR